MIIFTILWWIIKIWFLIWMYFFAGIGFLAALGMGIALVLFGWECVVGWIKKKPLSLYDIRDNTYKKTIINIYNKRKVGK